MNKWGNNMEITQELVRELYDYRDDGKLIHKMARKGAKVGTEAGWLCSKGYCQVSVLGKLGLSHRIIFLYHHGYLPKMVDHINGVRTDNRIENLRECTMSQNKANSKGTAVSGYKGVRKRGRKWYVNIKVNSKAIWLGAYDNIETAAQVAAAAREHYFGEFANHEHREEGVMNNE
tara:strand:+ start:2639 stop:3163 length:525 start_codon:yes stop_codon:yes gene_type:complete